jgi:hypothetical protein
LVFGVTEREQDVLVEVFLTRENRSIRILAQELIWASPSFLIPYILREADQALVAALREFQYAPWLVANLSLRMFPQEHKGMAPAWDNVIYDSDSLGYVVATHQSLVTHPDATVLTYYYPLASSPPAQARRALLARSWQDWVEWILRDLSHPHPDIRQWVSHIDIFRWGHAMIRPRIGFVWGEARQRVLAQQGRIHFAHSDLSAYSVFEEALYRGVLAADQVLGRLGGFDTQVL